MAVDPILAYAQNIIAAPDEWTPSYTRSELLPMARAYVAANALTLRAEPIDRVPSHSSLELPCYIQIDRQNFAVDAWDMTGAELRALPIPPIRDDYDLWKVEPARDDSLVRPEDEVSLRGGRFYTSPRYINAG